jgi:integrase
MNEKFTRHAAGRKAEKPAKPRPDFPLYAHAVGRWAKTIRGRTFYFGTWSDPEGALREYLDAKDDLYAGRTPGSKGGVTVRDVCNAFIRSKRIDLDAGRLSPCTFCDYDRCCRALIDEFGATRRILDLKPNDFEKHYTHLSHQYGVATLGREITMRRSVFRYAYESDLIDRPVKFGPKFKTPSKQDLRKFKAKSEHANGKKLFTAKEIRVLLGIANPQLKAMILLGINGGMGNTDCSSLPLTALDLDGAWLIFSRPKTGINRRIPLWSETVAALRQVIVNRRQPADKADAGLVFLTRSGLRWVRYGFKETKRLGKTLIRPQSNNQLAKEFSKLLFDFGLKRPRIGFYTLRHTFETIAGGCKDQVAVDSIMGYSDPSIASEYRHGIDDSRLRAVVEHVRQWLFAAQEGGQEDEQ